MPDAGPNSETQTLLCFSSVVRSYSSVALESLKKNLFPYIGGYLDIVGHSPPGNELLIESLRPFCRHLLWKFVPDPEFTDQELAMDCRAESVINVLRNNLLQWHSLEQCGRLKQEFEETHGPADRVIWTRPDMLFLWPADVPQSIPAGVLYASPHDMWRGFNDRFCLGDSRTMAERMAIGRFFREEWYPSLMQDPDGVLGGPATNWNPEFVLGCLIKSRGFTVRPSYTMFCRLRELKGRLYAMTPHQHAFRLYFPDLMPDDGRAEVRQTFEDRVARMLAEQSNRGVLVDPRAKKYQLSFRQKLHQWLSGRNDNRRLVPVERLRALESRAA